VRDRIAALDVLRGVAILGTFASNAWLFAHPGGPAGWLLDGAPATGGTETVLRTLSNGKFLALLTLLFGVGLAIQRESAARRGAPWPGRYPVRAAVLFAEGLLHYLLVFEFDVLMGYALTSLLVAHLLGRSERVQRAWAVAVGAVFAVLVLALTALLVLAPDGPAAPPVPTAPDWPSEVLRRIELAGLFRAEMLLVVPSATVLFLVGARLLRAGAFAPTPDGGVLRRRLAVVGLGVGVPLNALTAAAGPDWFLVDRYLVPPLVAVGLLAAVTELAADARRRPPPGPRGGRADGAVGVRAAERPGGGAVLDVGPGAGGPVRRRPAVVGGRAVGRGVARGRGGVGAVAAPVRPRSAGAARPPDHRTPGGRAPPGLAGCPDRR
jgi:uncharacterized protein